MNVIERMMTNPGWDADRFFFVRIDIEDGEFEAKLYLDTSEKADLHTFATARSLTIAGALDSLSDLVNEQIIIEASEHFLQKSLREEEEEAKA